MEKALSELHQAHEELKAAQLQLIQSERLEAVSTFAGGIAHEVKNPLQTITLGVDRHTPGAAAWVSDALAVDERAGRVFVAEDNGSAAHVSVLDARGRLVRHAGPVGVFPMAVAVDARAGHVVIVGGPLLQQSNAFDAMTASIADFLSKHLNHMLTWFVGSMSGGNAIGSQRGSISVLDVPR